MHELKAIIEGVLANNGKSYAGVYEVQTNLRNDIGLDSLDLAELTVLIEEKYGVDIFEKGIVETVGEIEHKLNARK
jgi:acyl carrier protein